MLVRWSRRKSSCNHEAFTTFASFHFLPRVRREQEVMVPGSRFLQSLHSSDCTILGKYLLWYNTGRMLA